MYPGLDSSDLCNYVSVAQARQEVNTQTIHRHGGWRRRPSGPYGWRLRLDKFLIDVGRWLQQPSLRPERPAKQRKFSPSRP